MDWNKRVAADPIFGHWLHQFAGDWAMTAERTSVVSAGYWMTKTIIPKTDRLMWAPKGTSESAPDVALVLQIRS